MISNAERYLLRMIEGGIYCGQFEHIISKEVKTIYPVEDGEELFLTYKGKTYKVILEKQR